MVSLEHPQTEPSTPDRTSRLQVKTQNEVGEREQQSPSRPSPEYFEALSVPSPERRAEIEKIQIQKEQARKHRDSLPPQERPPSSHGLSREHTTEHEIAAGIIQRNYRGYRERRQLGGLGLDPSTRWKEAIKEARYRSLTQPHARSEGRPSLDSVRPGSAVSRGDSIARQNWKKVGNIARRAGGDDSSDSDDDDLSEQQRLDLRHARMEEKREREKSAKMMDLQYFLEMVDVKHRYGSNLRSYHEVWKRSDTNENFFYWLDYGEGREVDLQMTPRTRLESEQVRYLSREERLNYLVRIDEQGRFCWAKNGNRIDTSVSYKDSIAGIVPEEDCTPPFSPQSEISARPFSASSKSTSSTQTTSSHNEAETPSGGKSKNEKSVNPKQKDRHVSAAMVLDHLLRKTVSKNTWIYVADTSFRLYVGIKQAGAFQHSSFLHGARVASAGTIKLKNGQLRQLSPLSGHYRAPTSSFRAFVHALKSHGADMSRVSISRSYGILLGLEAYVKTRRRVKKLTAKVLHHNEKGGPSPSKKEESPHINPNSTNDEDGEDDHKRCLIKHEQDKLADRLTKIMVIRPPSNIQEESEENEEPIRPQLEAPPPNGSA